MGQHDRQGSQDNSIERSAVGSDQTDAQPENDIQGHGAEWSDRDLKEPIEPLTAEPEAEVADGAPEDDSQGHKLRGW